MAVLLYLAISSSVFTNFIERLFTLLFQLLKDFTRFEHQLVIFSTKKDTKKSKLEKYYCFVHILKFKTKPITNKLGTL